MSQRHFAIATAGAFSLLACGAADAAPMTCGTFETLLEKQIHAYSDQVAIPGPYQLASGDGGDAGGRYHLGGIVGVDGDLLCLEKDQFDSLGIEGQIDSDDPDENKQRIYRTVALGEAALCALSYAPRPRCHAMIDILGAKAAKAFVAAKARGEESPSGSFGVYFEGADLVSFSWSADRIGIVLKPLERLPGDPPADEPFEN